MNDALTEILAECLERMEAGASLESCLAAFPNQAAELEPLLGMIQQMGNLTAVGPRQAFARNSRLQLENQLTLPKKAVTFERQNRHIKQKPNLFIQRRFKVLQFVLATLLALIAGTGGVAYAANVSNPGDPLHGLDLAMEQTQLSLVSDASTKVKLRIAFAQERLNEAQTTFSNNDVTDGLKAINEYGTEISDITQLIGSAHGADQEALTSLYESAHSVHQDVLTKLLDRVPPQAKGAIQRALQVSHAPFNIPPGLEHHGPPSERPGGPPTNIHGGPPNGVPGGKP
jgi:Domain of unknown function (DUF5667)